MKLMFLILLICLGAVNGVSQTNLEFAERLLKDKDYYRAITEFERVQFFSNDSALQSYCTFQTAKAYFLSKKPKNSITYFNRFLNTKTFSDSLRHQSQLYIGLNYVELKSSVMAEPFFIEASDGATQGLSSIYRGLIRLEVNQWDSAAAFFESVYKKYPDTRQGLLGKLLTEDAYSAKFLPRKSPFVATLFSSIVPGSGQLYSHHYYDGIQAFAYVGAFALASYAAYRYESKFNKNYIFTGLGVSVTAIFHLGNIIGAKKTAEYYNLRQKQIYVQPMKDQILKLAE